MVLIHLDILDFLDSPRETLPTLRSGWGGWGQENWREGKLGLKCKMKTKTLIKYKKGEKSQVDKR